MISSSDFSLPRKLEAPGSTIESEGVGPLSGLEEAINAAEPEARKAVAVAAERVSILAQRTKQALAAGAVPSDFVRLRALVKACEAAREILDQAIPVDGHDARMHSRKFF